MTIPADEQWIAAARDRHSRSGSWERDADTIFEAIKAQTAADHAADPALSGCPACAEHPAMLRFPRYELLTIDPLVYCGRCYGFWAVGDSLVRGVADPGYIHPALESVPAPRRCRACLGHLKDDDTCRKCGQPSPVLDCPQCARPMERHERDGVRLDQCTPCQGTWFDVGEIAAVYKLAPVQGLAASTVDENAPDNVPPAWWLAANVLARLFVPFLPF